MKRIGVAASKISKGSSFLYNALVVVISCLVSLFLFIVVGATVICALAVMAYFTSEVMPIGHERNWEQIRTICMSALAIIITVFNLMAIWVNIKLPHRMSGHE